LCQFVQYCFEVYEDFTDKVVDAVDGSESGEAHLPTMASATKLFHGPNLLHAISQNLLNFHTIQIL
jgi:hypothetical protein